MKRKSIAIICGGGPAPGINTVISTISKVFLKDGYRVLGVHHGYEGLFSDKPEVKELDFFYADRIFPRGGSTLVMSRFKPKDSDFKEDFFVKENVKLLVTVGGDDTASTAIRLTQFLKKSGINVSNIHVPKTIDNDIPLPKRSPTFGFNSAKDEGVKIGNTLYEDARTTYCWFLMSTMGRSAGHLGFEIASACHLPMMIIPEMFNKTECTLDKIISLIVSSIVKRKIDGVDYGVALIGEGVFHILSDEDITNSGIKFTYDAHGHPELGNVSKSNIFNILLQEKLKSLNLSIKSRPVDVGYELRCCSPVGFDLTLCTLLGIGVKDLFDKGLTGCIVSADEEGNVWPLFLSDFTNTEGKIPPRMVDIESQIAKLYFQNLSYITKADYKRAKKFLPDPENYDFHKILNW